MVGADRRRADRPGCRRHVVAARAPGRRQQHSRHRDDFARRISPGGRLSLPGCFWPDSPPSFSPATCIQPRSRLRPGASLVFWLGLARRWVGCSGHGVRRVAPVAVRSRTLLFMAAGLVTVYSGYTSRSAPSSPWSAACVRRRADRFADEQPGKVIAFLTSPATGTQVWRW